MAYCQSFNHIKGSIGTFYLPGYGIWERRSDDFVQHLAGFLFACLTDYWDGVLARHQGQTTKLGKLLDPVADKILIGSLLVLLVAMGRAPALLTVFLISREFIINGLRSIAAAEGVVISASSGGKIKTISQMLAVGFLIIHYPTIGIPCHEVGVILLWISTAISLWSGYNYVASYYLSLPDK